MKLTGQRNKPEREAIIFCRVIITYGTQSAKEGEAVTLYAKLSHASYVSFN